MLKITSVSYFPGSLFFLPDPENEVNVVVCYAETGLQRWNNYQSTGSLERCLKLTLCMTNIRLFLSRPHLFDHFSHHIPVNGSTQYNKLLQHSKTDAWRGLAGTGWPVVFEGFYQVALRLDWNTCVTLLTNQIPTKKNQLLLWPLAFSRASCSLCEFCLISRWFYLFLVRLLSN